MLRAPRLQSPHAFTTRRGGVSAGVYAGLNSSGLNMDERAMNGVQDDPQHVQENRRLTLEALGFGADTLSLLDQVHGTDVVQARASSVQPGTLQTGDAQVSDRPGVVLGILSADCYPILLEDAAAGVIGAAHAGWKGTLGRVAGRTVAAMTRLGARPERIRAAVGPGISAAQYPVGQDTAQQFLDGGLGEHVQMLSPLDPSQPRPNQPHQAHLDLAGANAQVLREAGVLDIWVSGRCTTGSDFYSHRRDAGRTGRMLACIGLRQPQPGRRA